ncbi:hypothetical protein SO802_031047 [Lithocarpus litseifolius]|uniref:Uncharacterized protein n=1 Tax=Lithocarpus litseifolius TaxID=425828 RepID=A0AAW2BLA1_9ROSI
MDYPNYGLRKGLVNPGTGQMDSGRLKLLKRQKKPFLLTLASLTGGVIAWQGLLETGNHDLSAGTSN